MAFNQELHSEADLLRSKIISIQNSISSLENLKDRILGSRVPTIKLVYEDEDENLVSLNVSSDLSTSNALINQVISDLETDLSETETDYENICSSGEGE